VIRGVSFDKNDVRDGAEDGYLPILRAGNIQGNLIIDDDLVWVPKQHVAEEQLLQLGDVAIAMSSGSSTVVGKVAQLNVPWKGAVGAFCAAIRFGPSIIPRFGAYWLRGPSFQAWRLSQCQGANIQNLRKTDLEAIHVPVPPVPEQKHIIAILDAAEDLRRLREQADRRTADLIPAMFHEMFGDPATNPKGWPELSLNELCTVKGGKRLPKGDEYATEPTPFRYIRVTDFSGGMIDESRLLYLKTETQKQISRYTVGGGDIIISIAGTIGLTAVVPPSLGGANLTENAAKLEAKSAGAYDPVFLCESLRTTHAQGQIGSHTGQVTIGKLALFRIEKLMVILPPLSLQRDFADRVAGIRIMELGQAASRRRLDDLFQSLLHRAFQGDL